jgi:RHS repeat-associated protein
MILGLAASLCFGQGTNLGQSQIYVELPDFAALNSAGDPAQNLAAFETSLQSAEAAPQNPNGLTVAGSIDILGTFSDNLDEDIPCDEAVRAIADTVVDLYLPYDILLRAVTEETGCDGTGGPGTIDEIIKDPGTPFDGFEWWCIDVDVNGICIEWITTKPCDVAGPDCSCERTDPQTGECTLWRTTVGPGYGGGGGSGGGTGGVDPGEDPGIDPGEDPGTGGGGGDPGPPGDGGGGGGPPGGGGGNPSASGVSSTSGGDCENSDNSDKTAPNGPTQMTNNPVMRSKGFKYEEDVDLFVSLPGRDFVLKRSYTAAPIIASSKMSMMIGSGWSTTADGWIDFTPHGWEPQGEETLPGAKPDFNGLPAYLTATLIPLHSSMRFYQSNTASAGSRTFRSVQYFGGAPATSAVSEIATTIGTQQVGLWRLESPGNGYTDFYRDPTGDLEILAGRIYRQVDGAGNEWNFEYIPVLDTNGDPARARLRRIYLNGESFLNSDGVVEFSWDIGTASNPGSGLLREITAFRPHIQPDGNRRLIATQYVRYTYMTDDPVKYDHLVDGVVNSLVLVESGSLVNAPGPGESYTIGMIDDLEYHRRYTHFRYKQAIHIKRSLGFGASYEFDQGVLTHRFNPEQVEYFAEQWLNRSGAPGGETMEDAVAALLDASLSDSVPGGGTAVVSDYAAKVISYYDHTEPATTTNGYKPGSLAFKVKSQKLQSACGCGSGSSHSVESYEYAKRDIVDGNLTATIDWGNATTTSQYYTFRTSSATTITESSVDAQQNTSGVRETTSWSEEHTILSGLEGVQSTGGGLYVSLDMIRSPFVVGNHVKDIQPGGTTREWSSFHEFDEDTLQRSRRFHPSAVNSVSFDANSKLLTYTSPAIPDRSAMDSMGAFTLSANDGFVEWWEYDTKGQLESEGVQRGQNGTQITTKAYEYSTIPGRHDLLTKRTAYASGSPDADLDMVVEYSYQTANRNGVKVVTEKTTKVAIEGAAQNGPAGTNNFAETVEEFELASGRPTKTMQPDGSITEYEYERTVSTSGISGTATIHSFTDDWLEMKRSGGSITPLVSTAYYDDAGRMRSMTSPTGVTTYTSYLLAPVTTYNDPGTGAVMEQTKLSYLSMLSFPHELGSSASPRFAGPMTQSWATAGMNLIRESSYELIDLDLDAYMPTVTYWQAGDESTRAVHKYGPTGDLYESRVWHDLDALSVEDGSYRTQFSYDTLGRLNQMISPKGTVTRTTYDADDRVIRVESGPDEQTLTVRSEIFYDHELDGTGNPVQGIGPGNPTLSRTYVDGTTTRDQVAVFDWRNRKRLSFTAANDVTGTAHYSTAAAGSATANLLDNLGRPIEVASIKGRVGGTGGDLTSLISAFTTGPEPATLFGATSGSVARTHYNKRGKPYATEKAIDPTNETAGFLRTENWYDEPGRLITSLSPNGASTKTRYDALGRADRVWVTDGAIARNGGLYADIVETASPTDYFYEQTETQFNAVGLPVMSISTRRNHSATELSGIGSNPITTYSATVYDDASRAIGSVAYGTNLISDIFESGGAAPAVPTAIPDRVGNPDLIISETVYDEIGRGHQTVDPEGRVNQLVYDDMGRAIATIENQVSGGVDLTWNATTELYEVSNRPAGTPDQNRVSSMVYDSEGNVVKRVAHLVAGGSERVQVTAYDYDPSAALSGDLAETYGNLYAIHYPEPGSGSDPYGDSDVGKPSILPEDTVRFAYNYLGEQILALDQNGTKRAFTRDELGRLTEETVQVFGSGVDTTIKTLVTEYDALGRTSRNDSLDGLSVSQNRLDYIYNSMGDLQELKQYATAARVSANTPESITWAYEVLNASSGNEFRLESMTYPDGSKLEPEYASTMTSTPVPADDAPIDRVREFTFYEPGATSGEMLVEYEHLGSGTVAIANFGLYQMDRTADDQGNRDQAGKYPGWDRFGRLAHNAWAHSTWTGSNHAAVQQTSFAYDRLSNRLEKFDLRVTAHEPDRDWEFQYDELNRMIEASRGVFSSSGTTLEPGSKQWTLDELGNWSTVSTLNVAASDYSAAVDENRAHNATNELINIGAGQDGRTYDHNGNLLTANGKVYIYDAWNRLVEIRQGSATIAKYDYNALHWRVAKRALSPNGVDDMQRLMYYSPSWQLLYEDIDDTYDGSAHQTARTALQVWGKRGGDDALYRSVDDGGDGTHERGFRYVTDDQFSVVALIDDSRHVYERLRYDAYGKPEHAFPEDFDQSNGAGTMDIFDWYAFSAFYNAQDLRADLEIDGVFDGFDTFAMQTAISNKDAPSPGWISDAAAFGPDNRIGYTGFVWDAEAGLWLGRNRLYDPEAGRWLQRDPAGYVDGLSMYLFVRGNPLSYIDPMGLASEGGGVLDWIGSLFGLSDSSEGSGSTDCDNARRKAEGVPNSGNKLAAENMLGDPEKRKAVQEAIVDQVEGFGEFYTTSMEVVPGGALLRGAYIYQTQGPQAAAKYGATTGTVNLAFGAFGGPVAKVGGKAVGSVIPKGLLPRVFKEVSQIRFSQNSIGKNFSDGSPVSGLTDALRAGSKSAEDVPPIRVFERDGNITTLDNRRLHAFQQADAPIRVTPASMSEIRRETPKKLTTDNNGTSVHVREGNKQ